MRIGVDACCWANDRGYGRFTRELLRILIRAAPEDEWICFLDESAAAVFDQRAANVRVVEVRQGAAPTRAASADGYRSPADMLRFTRAVWREHVDVFFSPSVYTYFPLPPGVPAVVAIHDTIAERFPQLTFPSSRAALFWRVKVRLAIRQAKLILTVSDYSARELETVFQLNRARIRVVPEAAAEVYRPSKTAGEVRAAAHRVGLGVDDAWFMYVGGFNPHKRVDMIVRAHAAVVRDGVGVTPHLLLVGDAQTDVFYGSIEQIRRTVAECGTEALVHWTGFVPDDELRHLHTGAVALLLVSEEEGFGLPAVEAAACGTPVIATTASPLPEVLEGGGVFVAPGDEAAVVEAMRMFLRDPAARRTMGERASERASRLSWSESARLTLAALRAVAVQDSPRPTVAAKAGASVVGGATE